MAPKRKLMLDATGRFLAEPRPDTGVQQPRGELWQLLAPLERICGN
jgi:hypothetical protein